MSISGPWGPGPLATSPTAVSHTTDVQTPLPLGPAVLGVGSAQPLSPSLCPGSWLPPVGAGERQVSLVPQ